MEQNDVSDIESLRAKIRRLSGDQFISQLKQLCLNSAKDFGILTYGFIIYDESTPEIRKTLRDSDYWSAIDTASGERMLVFALEDKSSFELRVFHVTSAPVTFDRLTESYSHLMKAVFGDKLHLVYPSVLLFQVDDGKIDNYLLVPLARGDEHEAATRIQTLFKSIADVLAKVTRDNFRNRAEIFELVRKELLHQKYRMYILRGPPALAAFIEAVKNLLFLG